MEMILIKTHRWVEDICMIQVHVYDLKTHRSFKETNKLSHGDDFETYS
jgi:hypothetical protein